MQGLLDLQKWRQLSMAQSSVQSWLQQARDCLALVVLGGGDLSMLQELYVQCPGT